LTPEFKSSTNSFPDGGFQKPNRLDPSEHWQCPPYTRPHTCCCASMWRIPVFQCSELSADPWSVDANVCYSESIFNSQSVHPFPG
jgi:hypothetical protein